LFLTEPGEHGNWHLRINFCNSQEDHRVAKPEWGTKRTCQSCGAPFYDLKKKNIECLKCGAAFNPNPPAKPRRPTPSTPKAAEDKPLVPPEAEGKAEDKTAPADKDGDGGDSAKTPAPDVNGDGEGDSVAEDAGDDEEDSLIEDTSDLGTEDDDMSEVKEHIDEGVEDKN
jgi:uncharacterized protein (TIGR02300 family)